MNIIVLLIILAVLFGGVGYSPYGSGFRAGVPYGLVGILVIIALVYMLDR